LAKKAEKKLKELGYKNVKVKHGSGITGWEKEAPFDGIVITAGVGGKVPKVLFKQLKKGGVLVAPVGRGWDKRMVRYYKKADGKYNKKKYGVFHFVPFVED
jgi:protein-L-isoaspartate(D-aspartate) O-methyltransferase